MLVIHSPVPTAGSLKKVLMEDAKHSPDHAYERQECPLGDQQGTGLYHCLNAG